MIYGIIPAYETFEYVNEKVELLKFTIDTVIFLMNPLYPIFDELIVHDTFYAKNDAYEMLLIIP